VIVVCVPLALFGLWIGGRADGALALLAFKQVSVLLWRYSVFPTKVVGGGFLLY
jgi:hypothetical protein